MPASRPRGPPFAGRVRRHRSREPRPTDARRLPHRKAGPGRADRHLRCPYGTRMPGSAKSPKPCGRCAPGELQRRYVRRPFPAPVGSGRKRATGWRTRGPSCSTRQSRPWRRWWRDCSPGRVRRARQARREALAETRARSRTARPAARGCRTSPERRAGSRTCRPSARRPPAPRRPGPTPWPSSWPWPAGQACPAAAVTAAAAAAVQDFARPGPRRRAARPVQARGKRRRIPCCCRSREPSARFRPAHARQPVRAWPAVPGGRRHAGPSHRPLCCRRRWASRTDGRERSRRRRPGRHRRPPRSPAPVPGGAARAGALVRPRARGWGHSWSRPAEAGLPEALRPGLPGRGSLCRYGRPGRIRDYWSMCRRLAFRQACLPRRPGERWPAGPEPEPTWCRRGGATRTGAPRCRDPVPGRSRAERGRTAAAGHARVVLRQARAAPRHARAAPGRAPARGRVRRRCVLPPRTGPPSGAGRSGWRGGKRAGHAAAPGPRGTGPESATAGARPVPQGPAGPAALADHEGPGRTGSPPEWPQAPPAEPHAGPAEPAPGVRRGVRPHARPARAAPARSRRSPARRPFRGARAAVPPGAWRRGCRPPERPKAEVRRAAPSPSRASPRCRARPAAGPHRPPDSARPGRRSR